MPRACSSNSSPENRSQNLHIFDASYESTGLWIALKIA
jgi:hypothetical protein